MRVHSTITNETFNIEVSRSDKDAYSNLYYIIDFAWAKEMLQGEYMYELLCGITPIEEGLMVVAEVAGVAVQYHNNEEIFISYE